MHILTRDDDDFVIHHLGTCSDPVPVWTALEYVSFGNLPHLLDLMRKDDLQKIAKDLGVKREVKFITWVRAIAYLRNKCAHNARIFNRRFKYSIKVTQGDLDSSQLRSSVNLTSNKIYLVSAVLAYMLKNHNVSIDWARTFLKAANSLLDIKLSESGEPYFSLEGDMGFPAG